MAENAAGGAPDAGLRPPAARTSLAAFVARVIACGVIAFGAWHLAAQPLSLACGRIASAVVEAIAPVDHARAAYRDGALVFSVDPDYETLRRRGLRPGTYFDIPATPLTYTYALPFFLALILASRPRGLAWKALLGAGVIAVFAGAGIGFSVLVSLGGLQTAAGDALFAFSRTAREAIALGYQLGTLILPPLAPVLLWMALDWRSIMSLTGRVSAE